MPRGRIRLGSDDQPEGLQIRAYMQARLIGRARHDFGEVPDSALRSYGPERIRKILAPEPLRRKHAFKIRIDLRAPALRFHGRLAFGLRHQNRAPEIDSRRSLPVLIINSADCVLDYGDVKDWGLVRSSQAPDPIEAVQRKESAATPMLVNMIALMWRLPPVLKQSANHGGGLHNRRWLYNRR